MAYAYSYETFNPFVGLDPGDRRIGVKDIGFGSRQVGAHNKPGLIYEKSWDGRESVKLKIEVVCTPSWRI